MKATNFYHQLVARVSSVEECSNLHHVREFTRRIIVIEERIGVNGGVIGETLRECKVRLDQRAAGCWPCESSRTAS